jgi:CubicO group peptidase (beta-lactamase class C family)
MKTSPVHNRSIGTAAVLALSLLTLAPASPVLAAAPDAATVQYIDNLFSQNYPAAEPGAAVLVEKDGQVILRKGYGLANLELGVPVRPDMVFEVGSVTKQFTAAAILMLAERGRLKLEDDVTRHLPDFPTQGKTVTIEHLLTHTSGIPSYTGMEEWAVQRREDIPVDQLIALFRGKPFDFEPGEKWSYNNSGYVLLGAIIEKLSGKTYEDFIEQEIFKPAGMDHSRYGNPAEIVAGRAYGYDKDDETYRNASYLSMTQPYAAGALMSTVDDLSRWNRALTGGTLLRGPSFTRMVTPARLRSGISTGYGYGLGAFDFYGHRLIEHGGDIDGFTAYTLTVPEDRLFIAVLSNNPNAPQRPDALVLRAAARLLGRPLESRPTLPLKPEALAEYVGVYRFDPKIARAILLENGQLYSQRTGAGKLPIVPVERDVFAFETESRARFVRDAAGKITGMEMIPRFGPGETGQRTDEPIPAERQAVKVDPALYDAYVGEYALNPRMTIAILREGDRLFALPTGQKRLEIFPSSESEFFVKEVDARIVFTRGEGKAEKLVLHQGGKEMPAPRVK